MSETTFKNARPQRKYRERSQPFQRKHLGLLEKHKDYKERAINYHRKQDKLKNLQLKASLKNKDEFNFKMIKGQIKDGKHINANESDDEDSDFDADEYKKIVKTQNQNLLKLQLSRNERRVNRLQGELHMVTKAKENKHKFFKDNELEVEQFELPEYLNEQKEGEVDPLRHQYAKLDEAKKQCNKMRGFFLKLNYEKGLLGKEKKRIKKYKTGKIHKFYYERKK